MLKHFVAPLFWAGIILFLSSIPSNDIPSFELWDLVKSDKIGHVIMYFVLSFQLMRGCIRQYASWKLRYNATSFAATMSIAYGGFIELYQHYFLTDRYGDWVDLAANAVGTILGVVAFRMIFSDYIR
jgi:VanZ family protein